VKVFRQIGIPAALLVHLVLLRPGPVWSQPAEANTVLEVRVEGNKVLSDSAVLVHVKVRPGQPYNEQVVRDDEQRLLKTGRFTNVAALKTQTDKGVIVTFRVVERPVIQQVRFQGNKAFPDKELSKSIGFGPGDPVDLYRIVSGRRAIESRYRSDGYSDVRVDYDKTALARKQQVIYTIVEGTKTYVDAVRFKGNKAFSARRLNRVVSSRGRLWPLRTGVLDMEAVERDVVELRNFYRSEGFLEAEVHRELAFDVPQRKKVVLTFLIEEGRRFRIRKTRFEGTSVFAPAELDRQLRLIEGVFYNGLALRRDLEKIRALYGEIGYVDATVTHRIVYPPEPGLVDLVYTIAEGRQFRVGRVDIRGNDVTKMNVIRRQLQFRPQQLYDTVAVDESRQRLMETRLFEKVEIVPFGQAADIRNALVEVAEGQTGQFLIGAGVSTNAGLLGNISYTERNFDLLAWPRSWRDVVRRRAFKGAGQSLHIAAEPGTEFMRFRIDWREPYLFDKPYSLGASVYLFTSDRETWDETRYGTVVSLGHRFPNRWYGEIAGRVEGVSIDGLDQIKAPPDVWSAEGTSGLASVKGTVIRDTTDSRWLPSAGDRISLSCEQVVGSPGPQAHPRGAGRRRRHLRDQPDVRSLLRRRARVGARLQVPRHQPAPGPVPGGRRRRLHAVRRRGIQLPPLQAATARGGVPGLRDGRERRRDHRLSHLGRRRPALAHPLLRPGPDEPGRRLPAQQDRRRRHPGPQLQLRLGLLSRPDSVGPEGGQGRPAILRPPRPAVRGAVFFTVYELFLQPPGHEE